jgi:hypothetical protein
VPRPTLQRQRELRRRLRRRRRRHGGSSRRGRARRQPGPLGQRVVRRELAGCMGVWTGALVERSCTRYGICGCPADVCGTGGDVGAYCLRCAGKRTTENTHTHASRRVQFGSRAIVHRSSSFTPFVLLAQLRLSCNGRSEQREDVRGRRRRDAGRVGLDDERFDRVTVRDDHPALVGRPVSMRASECACA